MNSAIFVTPELTDFLGNKFYEDFDEATLIFSTTYLTAQLNIKVTVCEDRYIVISYGVSRPSFSYALIYDIALKRWGKLKITHRDCFSWVKPSLYGPVTYGQLISTLYGDLADTTYGQLNNMLPVPGSPKGSIAFLQKDGTVQTVDFSQAQTSADGVLIIGKFQYQRNYFMIHEMTDVENVQPSGAFSMYVIPSMDGKTLDPAVTTYAFPALPFSRKFAKRVVAQNISLLFTGSFNLTSLMLNFHNAGKR
jgi:hypothetical protein